MYNGHFGHTEHWDENAEEIGFTVDSSPTVNAIAQWDDDNPWNEDHGHVAVVTSVDGSFITVEEYNFNLEGNYSERTTFASSPDNYIHILD